MFNKLVPESPWCLHSLKWRRLPFPWLTAGILQIFVCFYFHCRGGERARRMTAHSNMAVGFCSDLKRVICQRVTSYLQTVLGVCCGLYRVPDLLRSKSEHQDWCHFSCQSQKNHPQVLFSHEQFNLLSLILQYIKDQQHRCIDVRRFSRCPPPAEWVSIMCENGWKGQRLRVTLRHPLAPLIVPRPPQTLSCGWLQRRRPVTARTSNAHCQHPRRSNCTSEAGLCKRRRRCRLPRKRTRCDVENVELVLVPVGSNTAPVLLRMSNFFGLFWILSGGQRDAEKPAIFMLVWYICSDRAWPICYREWRTSSLALRSSAFLKIPWIISLFIVYFSLNGTIIYWMNIVLCWRRLETSDLDHKLWVRSQVTFS